MKLHVNFLENDIDISNDIISVLEIENKKYFYRIVNNLYSLSNKEEVDEVEFYSDKDEELKSVKLQVIIDFFDFGLTSKKIMTEVQKSIVGLINEENSIEINKAYNNLCNKMIRSLKDIDLPLEVSEEFDLLTIIKLFNVTLKKQDNLLDNLLLLIDINKDFKIYDILFFINLKQYLNSDEIKELYKYAIYNNVKISLIDSQSYGVTLDYEKKLIIDDNLDEFVL